MPAKRHVAAIRRLLERERAAHVGRDASLLVSLFADDFAWMEAWERRGDAWALQAVASTNEPD